MRRFLRLKSTQRLNALALFSLVCSFYCVILMKQTKTIELLSIKASLEFSAAQNEKKTNDKSTQHHRE